MIYKLFFFFLSVGFVLSTTPVKRCPGVKDELFNSVTVLVDDKVCDKMPCELVSGKDVTTEISFTVSKEISEIKMMCNATALGVTISYPLPEANEGCNKLTNTYCPIEPNTDAELTLTMNVLKVFPRVEADLTFYLLDQDNEMISCFQVNTKVVAKKQH